jgi:hypothetical protein
MSTEKPRESRRDTSCHTMSLESRRRPCIEPAKRRESSWTMRFPSLKQCFCAADLRSPARSKGSVNTPSRSATAWPYRRRIQLKRWVFLTSTVVAVDTRHCGDSSSGHCCLSPLKLHIFMRNMDSRFAGIDFAYRQYCPRNGQTTAHFLGDKGILIKPSLR